MSSYYRPYFERERNRGDREREPGWDRRREQRWRRSGYEDEDLDRGYRDLRGREPLEFDEPPPGEGDFRRGRFEQFEDWERPRELSSSSFGRMRAFGSPSMHGRAFGRYVGRGPKGYQRTDDRIKEEVCDRLTEHPDVDASEVEVSVQNGEVMLGGAVPDRHMKREIEDCIEAISGVRDVQNRIRVGGPVAASPAAARDPESEERENIGGVSRFWRSGN